MNLSDRCSLEDRLLLDNLRPDRRTNNRAYTRPCGCVSAAERLERLRHSRRSRSHRVNSACGALVRKTDVLVLECRSLRRDSGHRGDLGDHDGKGLRIWNHLRRHDGLDRRFDGLLLLAQIFFAHRGGIFAPHAACVYAYHNPSMTQNNLHRHRHRHRHRQPQDTLFTRFTTKTHIFTHEPSGRPSIMQVCASIGVLLKPTNTSIGSCMCREFIARLSAYLLCEAYIHKCGQIS